MPLLHSIHFSISRLCGMYPIEYRAYISAPLPLDRSRSPTKAGLLIKYLPCILQASILHYARSITEAAADGAAILDCVITVPAAWGPSQRQALIDAAKISGKPDIFCSHEFCFQ